MSVRGSGFSARIDEALTMLGRKRRARLAVPHFLLVPEIVARSDMISAFPERLARGYANKLRTFEPRLKIDGFTVGQIGTSATSASRRSGGCVKCCWSWRKSRPTGLFDRCANGYDTCTQAVEFPIRLAGRARENRTTTMNAIA